MKNSKGSKNSLKSLISENNRFTKLLSVFFLALIICGLFAFIITGLYRFGLFEFPEFIQNIFTKQNGAEKDPVKDDGSAYEFLREYGESDNENAREGFSLEITLENIKEAAQIVKLPDNLHLETEANYYTGGKISKTERMSLWKKGAKYKYILTVGSIAEESYINNGKNEFIENFITGDKIKRTAPKAFSFESVPHISDIGYYLELTESGEISDFAVFQNTDSNTALIEYSVFELNQREVIEISLDTGIVLKTECRIGELDELYYESSVKVIEAYYDGDELSAEKTAIHDILFEIE